MAREIFCIYARAANGTIGKDGNLPWHLPADLKRFKKLTMNKPMIMGRKTFESLPGLLPGRRHIVLTRRDDWQAEGAETALSVGDALDMATIDDPNAEVAIIGGAAIYDVFLPQSTRVELTEVHAEYDGDTFMPPLGDDWVETAREDFPADDGKPAYSFVTLVRGPARKER